MFLIFLSNFLSFHPSTWTHAQQWKLLPALQISPDLPHGQRRRQCLVLDFRTHVVPFLHGLFSTSCKLPQFPKYSFCTHKTKSHDHWEGKSNYKINQKKVISDLYIHTQTHTHTRIYTHTLKINNKVCMWSFFFSLSFLCF